MNRLTPKISLYLKDMRITPLNRLYTPIVKKGKPAIITSKESRLCKALIRREVIKQKQNKMIEGSLSMCIDMIIANNKAPDIDAIQKVLCDALEGFCYENDSQIVDMHTRKHVNQGVNEVLVSIEVMNES
ncbi:MAG: RusA family crossover junction endodeoxyribonuclease [Campylobacterota bacterium]|nr:RusA family crossover junction endodeoxyribonuclease [Campylobacterota bacterium]